MEMKLMEKISTTIEKAFNDLLSTINASLEHMGKEINERFDTINKAKRELNDLNEEMLCLADVVEQASYDLDEMADNIYGVSATIEDFFETSQMEEEEIIIGEETCSGNCEHCSTCADKEKDTEETA